MTIGEGADRPYQRLSSRELLLIFLFWTSLATGANVISANVINANMTPRVKAHGESDG